MSEYKLHLIFVLFCILVSSAAGAGSAIFLQILIDDHIMPLIGVENPSYSGILQVILVVAFIYLMGITATLLFSRIMVVVGQGTLKKIRDTMFKHMQTLPVKYFDANNHGDVMSHFTNDTDTLRQAISMSFPQMVSSVFTVVAAFSAMLYLSIWLAIFVCFYTVLLLAVAKLLVSRSGKYFMHQQTAIGDVNGYIEEIINGQKVVKVFCREEKVGTEFDSKNDVLYKAASEANKYGNITMPVVNNLGFLLYVLLAIVGGLLGIIGMSNLSLTGWNVMTVGTIISFLTLSRSFVNPIGMISMQFNSVVMALAGASRIFELLDEKPEQDEGTISLVNSVIEGDIRFDSVDFGYNEETMVLHNISLYAKPGQKVALVGATGAGKTTITNLINRFYDIADGKITYDGKNINDIIKSDLRKSLGIVLQDVNLFTGTVMDNIRYGKLDATDEECIKAAKLVNADGFICMLPDGYQTVLDGDGSSLSQGQLQLISIARAAVADPPVMILDEATSSIDTRTETIVQKGMDALMHGRTVFVIAHRLSTVRNADVIMVMEHGRIIERGSHDELLKEKGKYYELYTGVYELD
ncbi:MAG: ABC transporter ATP-binding protein/permease [Oscillospiraceae bacterium]|nr:ABC transporter ATP-binding protein/permease [Oscillospiraceae bacterium]